jgi:succinate-acetate transporter protein
MDGNTYVRSIVVSKSSFIVKEEERNTRNQTILGAVLTFFFVFTFMYIFAGVH